MCQTIKNGKQNIVYISNWWEIGYSDGIYRTPTKNFIWILFLQLVFFSFEIQSQRIVSKWIYRKSMWILKILWYFIIAVTSLSYHFSNVEKFWENVFFYLFSFCGNFCGIFAVHFFSRIIALESWIRGKMWRNFLLFDSTKKTGLSNICNVKNFLSRVTIGFYVLNKMLLLIQSDKKTLT